MGYSDNIIVPAYNQTAGMASDSTDNASSDQPSATPSVIAPASERPVFPLPKADISNALLQRTRVAAGIISSKTTPPPTLLPTISQFLIGTLSGYQFAFKQTTNASYYRVYRNTAGTGFAGALLFQSYKDDPSNPGAVVVADNVPLGVFYSYWVTAVNQSGQETAPVAAQTGLVASGTNMAPATATLATAVTTLSQSGTSLTINVSAATYFIGPYTMNVNSGSVNVGSYNIKYYVYFDSPGYVGGPVTYQASSNFLDTGKGSYRVICGSITLNAGGGGGGGTGGSGGGGGKGWTL